MVKAAKNLLIGLSAFGLAVGGITAISPSTLEPVAVYASLEDDIAGGISNTEISRDDQSVADWISQQRGVTGEQLNKASQTLSPITNLVGYIVGGAVTLVFIGIFAITALDLVYISLPPFRNMLYKSGTDGTGAYTGGMPGGGYQMGYGYGGAGGAAGGSAKPTQWISDEAVACAAMLGGSSQSANNGVGPVNGNQQNVPMKSVIGTYFKKRIGFMIFLVIAAIVLTSSVLLGTGVNLAQWVLKIISFVNGYIPS